jgi:hypothetical protein
MDEFLGRKLPEAEGFPRLAFCYLLTLPVPPEALDISFELRYDRI